MVQELLRSLLEVIIYSLEQINDILSIVDVISLGLNMELSQLF